MSSRKPPAPSPAPPSNPVHRMPDTMPPFHPMDPIPQPDVSEKNTDTMWQLWHDVHDKEAARFADTVPNTRGAPISARPDSIPPGSPLRPVSQAGATGAEKLVEESRRNNRVCPQPLKWIELDLSLRAAVPEAVAASLPPPLPPREWKTTTALAKRLMFRNVLDWAGANGQVEATLAFVRALPEAQWLHMGD